MATIVSREFMNVRVSEDCGRVHLVADDPGGLANDLHACLRRDTPLRHGVRSGGHLDGVREQA